jgi:predicted O-methyltransferase YrrM
MSAYEVQELFPAGHFYSPIPDLYEVRRDHNRIFATVSSNEMKGIHLNTESQLDWLARIASYYSELPYLTTSSQAHLRYRFDNDQYSYTDAIFLYGMMRLLRPKRVIEIGSGWSSCVMLDTNAQFLDQSCQLTFVEPYPDRLLAAARGSEIHLLAQRVQDVPLILFQELEAGDILFVDSTHVSKVGSDVNYLLFTVLPNLPSGCIIHFHDIFWPFEYPSSWIYEGRAWNELYMIRAFLQFNSEFEILLFSHYLGTLHSQYLFDLMPLCQNNIGGNLWLRRR